MLNISCKWIKFKSKLGNSNLEHCLLSKQAPVPGLASTSIARSGVVTKYHLGLCATE